MELKSKYVLPKIQMILNGMLSQTQTSQIDFSHQEYSIQIKNRNQLTVNWYEPKLTDLQWVIFYFIKSLEFMGVKSLKHISVSHHQRKIIRILFWRVNALHFFEAEIRERSRIGNLRKSLIQSQKIIPIPLSNNDQVLYISEDLFPMGKKGVFFIETVNKQFYVLNAAQKKQQIIHLNQQNKISKLYSSVVGFWGSMIDENKTQKIVISNILVNELHDSESFKTITLREYEFEIRFVKIPINPGDKCKFQTYQLHWVNLKNIISDQLDQNYNLMLVRSQIYQMNQAQVMVVFLLKNVRESGYYFMLSVLIDYQKKEHREVKKLKFEKKGLLSVDFEKINDVGELKYLLLKEQYMKQTIISKVSLKTLQCQNSMKQQFEGDSILCSSEDDNQLLLLSPYKVFQINVKSNQMIQQNKQQVMEEENNNQTNTKVEQISNFISINKPKIQKDFQHNNFTSVLTSLSTISSQLNQILNSTKSSLASIEELRQPIKIWTAFSLYESIIRFELKVDKKLLDKHRKFNDLNINNKKNEYHQILTIFNHLIDDKKLEEFFLIWIDFLDFYKSRQFFNEQNVRKVQSQILNEHFSYLINKALEFVLTLKKNPNIILDFIKMGSGIIKIERQIYRRVLKDEINHPINEALKVIALQKINFDLIQVIYFETGQIHKQQIRQCFKSIKEQSEEHYKNFVGDFVLEYLKRMKERNVVNQEVKSFTNLLQIFPQQVEWIKKILNENETDLAILLSLREGQRKAATQRIFSVAQRMKNPQNKKKLFLTIQDLKKIEMKD